MDGDPSAYCRPFSCVRLMHLSVNLGRVDPRVFIFSFPCVQPVHVIVGPWMWIHVLVAALVRLFDLCTWV